MNAKIASWLAPPIFENDDEKTWRASLLNTTLLILILFDIVIIIGNLLGEDMPITIFIIDGIILVTCLLLRLVLFSGRVKLTGVLLLTTLFILFTAAIAILGTIRTPTTSLFLLLIIIAGLLFGQNGTIIMVVSSSLATASLLIAENAGILPSPDYTVNITQGITFTLLFGLTGLLVYLVCKTTSQSLDLQFKEVAAHKQTMMALQKECDFAESLVNTAQAIVLVLDVEGRIVRFNPYMEKISGYTLTEVQGKDWFRTFLPKDEQEEIRSLFLTAVSDNQTKGNINVIVTKDGRERKIEWYDKTLLDAEGNVEGLLAIGQDITEREQAATVLRLEQEQLNNILDAIEDGIYIVNQQFDIQYVNPVIRREFGAINNRKCYTYLHDRIDVCPWCRNDEILAGKSVHWEWYSQKNNKHYDLLDTLFINQDGSTSKFEIFHDITKRKQAEEALLIAKDAAEEANRAKSAFLSNMTHELRTPLNGILGYTQLFKRDATLTPEQQQGIDVIHRSGEHLLMMINDILDLSKIEADRIELAPIELEFSYFLQTIDSVIRMPAEQKGLTFNYQLDSNLPKVVLADETRLRQILLNLLSNAVKFTEQGNVRLRVQRLEDETVCRIRFEVEDSGIGIPQEQQANIFESFRQVGDGQMRHQGTGLGLAISQRLVRMMGGELHVESGGETAVGSRFWFDLALPLIVDAEKSKTSVMRSEIGYTRTAEDPQIETPPFKILLVDDLTQNRMVLNALLTLLGFTVEEADGGLDAIAKTASFKPDLIFMDLVMPNIDGLEATRQIRQQSGMEKLPIIAISANVNEKVRQQSIDAGCDMFLPKPFDTKLLLAKLEQYLPLQWFYEIDDTIAQMGHIRGSTGLLSDSATEEAPSDLELEKLLNLIMIGDISTFKRRLNMLEREDIRYLPFVTQLNQLTVNFKMDEIEQYIRNYLE